MNMEIIIQMFTDLEIALILFHYCIGLSLAVPLLKYFTK